MQAIFSNRRILLLALILVVSNLIITGVSILVVYKKSIATLQTTLVDIVERQKSVVQTLHEQGKSADEIIRFIEKMRENYYGIGHSGEFAIAHQTTDSIKYLLAKGSQPNLKISNTRQGIPMRLALAGRQGSVKGRDYKGTNVYAAYTFVPAFGWGIVAKIPVKEINKPFYKAILIAGLISLALIWVCIFLFIRISKPLMVEMAAEIEARKLAEKKIGNLNILLQSIIESAKEMIILSIDKDYKYINFNAAHKKVMLDAYGTDVFPGMDLLACITHETDKQHARENYGRALAGESHITIQEYGELERCFYETHYNPIFDSKHEIIGATAFASNISSRINAEIALQQSEERYKRITEGLTDYLYTVMVENGCAIETLHNHACIAVTGYSAEEFTADPYLWLDMVAPEEKDLVAGRFAKILAGEDLLSIEHRIICKNGSTRWISDTLIPKYGENGILLAYDGIIKDISERKMIEILLQEKNEEIEAQNEEYKQINEELYLAKERAEESEEKFKSYTRYTPVAIYTTDTNGHCIYANERWLEIAGLTFEQAKGKGWENALHPEDKEFVVENWYKSVQLSGKWAFEYRFMDKQGKITWVEGSAVALLNDENKIIGYLGSNADITERKIFQQELIASKEKAEESDRLKTAFLQNMSHEIRTPMNAIMGFSEILASNYDNKEKLEKFSGIITQRCNDLLGIINDLLDIARIESGQLSVNLDVCNLDELFAGLNDFFIGLQKRLGKNNIKFRFNTACELANKTIVTDTLKLKQIFINLLNNALKFTEEGTVEGGCKLDSDEYLIFYVSDTGIGIPHNKQQYIFERFAQVNNSPEMNIGGTGLGLAIVKGLLGLLGGELFLESEPGKGSIFSFKIPYRAMSELPPKPLPIEKPGQYNFLGKTVLIVEDDFYNAEYLKEILSRAGLNILQAEYAKQAVELARAQNVDLVLMDIRLPDFDGYEATRQIRQFKPGLKILAQTAYASIDERKKAFGAGLDDYLSKPTNHDILLAMVHKHLAIQ